MLRLPLLIAVLLLATAGARYKPVALEYTLRVDTTDVSGIAVELKVRNAPARLRLAAHAHPEYDDKYWRHVADLRATGAGGAALAIVREDSVVWQVGNVAGDVTIRYHVRFPREDGLRSPWLPFVGATGGLVGGPHSFLYVVGQEAAPAKVTLDMPARWLAASGLDGTPGARSFVAPDIHALMESPILVGDLRAWKFSVRGVSHRVFYWPLPDATPFDTVAFVGAIERLAVKTVELFGGMPYSEYTFLFQDGAYSGGLEHPNSVTLGAPSADLARDPNAGLSETAHEFVHTWNLMAIKPAEYRQVDYRVQRPVAGLWFSEGLTLFYADLLLRRAALPTDKPTRVDNLEYLMERYLSAPGNARYSAEAVSRVAYNASASALGDYTASAHLQGELIGTVLDLLVRDSTDGARSMDDVMRLMYTRFKGRGFSGRDVQAAVNEVCACRVDSFFEAHVRNAGAFDFGRYLAPFGLDVTTSWTPAVREESGEPVKDLRIWAARQDGENFLRLRITDPTSIWGAAGLHTGDELVTVNGAAVRTWPQFRAFLASFAIGDSATIVVQRPAGPMTARVAMRGYDRPVVRILPVEGAGERHRRLRASWLDGR